MVTLVTGKKKNIKLKFTINLRLKLLCSKNGSPEKNHKSEKKKTINVRTIKVRFDCRAFMYRYFSVPWPRLRSEYLKISNTFVHNMYVYLNMPNHYKEQLHMFNCLFIIFGSFKIMIQQRKIFTSTRSSLTTLRNALFFF